MSWQSFLNSVLVLLFCVYSDDLRRTVKVFEPFQSEELVYEMSDDQLWEYNVRHWERFLNMWRDNTKHGESHKLFCHAASLANRTERKILSKPFF